SVERLPADADAPAGYESLRLSARGHVSVRALIRRPKNAAGPAPALVLVAAEGESPKLLNALLASVNARDTAVRLLVFPPGTGEDAWYRDFYKAATRQAMQVGESVESVRLASVSMAVEALRKESSADPAKIL